MFSCWYYYLLYFLKVTKALCLVIISNWVFSLNQHVLKQCGLTFLFKENMHSKWSGVVLKLGCSVPTKHGKPLTETLDTQSIHSFKTHFHGNTSDCSRGKIILYVCHLYCLVILLLARLCRNDLTR